MNTQNRNLTAKRTCSLKVFALFIVFSCDSNSCTENVAGGFPSELRSGNRMQLKMTNQALEKVSDNSSLLANLNLGQEFNLTPDCSSTPEICCSGGNPEPVCGPIVIDTELQEGDLQRLELATNLTSNTIEVTLRTRIRSIDSIRVSTFGIGCDLNIDTTNGSVDDITFVVDLSPSIDPISRNTRFDVVGADLQNLQSDDLELDGNFLCGNILDPLLGLLRGTIRNEIEDQVTTVLNNGLCSSCPGGTVDECNAFADACTDGLCMTGSTCVQELGISGAISGDTISSALLGNIHLLSVLGESAEIQNNGLLFSFLTGSLPLGEGKPCGPEALPLPVTFEPPIPTLNGNTDPANNELFDIAIGLHQNYLNQFLVSGYNTGFFCLDIGVETSGQLVSSSIAPLLFPSLNDLLSNQNTPLEIGLRPQLTPSVFLGQREAGEDHTLLFQMPGLAIDFIAPIAGQDVVVLTTRFDLTLPVRLTADDEGGISLEITDLSDATSNFSVSNRHGLLESDQDLETRIPLLIQVALPGLLGSIGSFGLPGFGGFQLKIKPGGVQLLENDQFLGLFADLEPSDGTTQAGGCSSSKRKTPWGALLLLLFFTLAVKKKRIRSLLFLSFFASGCSSCGDDDQTSCEDTCLPGELSLNDVGSFNDIVVGAERTIVLAYEKELGDLLAADVIDEDSVLQWNFIDGVPDERPTFEPETLRNGIDEPGPDRGQAFSASMQNGLGFASYLGSVPTSLHFAAEESLGTWQSHPILETLDGDSHFTSIGTDDQGRIVIAYNLVTKRAGFQDFEGQLNIARSNDPTPTQSSDWTHVTVASVVVPCFDETCQSPWPEDVVSSPIGTGLYLQLLGDESEYVSYYDSVTDTWNLRQFVNEAWTEVHTQNESGSHSNTFLDSTGTFHVAFQKQRQLETFSFTPGSGVDSSAVVDNGLREGTFKPNLVGQGNAIFVEDNQLKLLYQDGSAANLRLAQRSETNEWTSDVFLESTSETELVGFRTHIDGQGGIRWASTYQLDPLQEQRGKLVLKILAE